MRVLVLGATGMLGSAVYTVLSRSPGFVVQGTVRSRDSHILFPRDLLPGLIDVSDLENFLHLEHVLDSFAPEVVINCLSLGKPLPADIMKTLVMFSVLPKRLSLLCGRRDIRLVQIGTDGVFSGDRGHYTEVDLPDAKDIYGIAKYLGEPAETHTVTLRTSILGPELSGCNGLLEWFLSQNVSCFAYRRVIFSGLPTSVLAEVIRDFVLPRKELHGIYHVAAAAISKFDLLQLIAKSYGKQIELVAKDTPISDRSLDASRFIHATGYAAPDWKTLVNAMHNYHQSILRT
jgi:dTDP-4-dehydrorhamnose reductase